MSSDEGPNGRAEDGTSLRIFIYEWLLTRGVPPATVEIAEHFGLHRWLGANRAVRGAVVTLEQVWRLAEAWYANPRQPGWRPRTRDESQRVLASVGLVGDFWELP